MFDDSTPIPFGKYKGVELAKVPAVILMGYYKQFIDDPTKQELIEYLDRNIEKLDPLRLYRPSTYRPSQSMVLPLCAKKAYVTQKEAKNALKKIRADKATHKKPIRTYECPVCSYWHLTSIPIDEFKEMAKNGQKWP